VREVYLKQDIDLSARHGSRNPNWLLPMPAAYIVDRRCHPPMPNDIRNWPAGGRKKLVLQLT